MNKKKLSGYLSTIKKIELIRAKNNKHWMDLYRLAFIHAPDKAGRIVNHILKKDQKVVNLVKKLKK